MHAVVFNMKVLQEVLAYVHYYVSTTLIIRDF